MASVINTNVMSLNSQRVLMNSQSSMATSLERLSSGLRINRAKDDAAGLAIAQRFTAQIRGLEQANRNANDGISLLQTAEGALDEVGNMLQRMRELAVQANNGSQSNETRRLIAVEVRQLQDELVQLANQKDGNGAHLFGGNLEEVTPVTRSGSAFSYNGDQGQRFIPIGASRQVADSDWRRALPGETLTYTVRNPGVQTLSISNITWGAPTNLSVDDIVPNPNTFPEIPAGNTARQTNSTHGGLGAGIHHPHNLHRIHGIDNHLSQLNF